MRPKKRKKTKSERFKMARFQVGQVAGDLFSEGQIVYFYHGNTGGNLCEEYVVTKVNRASFRWKPVRGKHKNVDFLVPILMFNRWYHYRVFFTKRDLKRYALNEARGSHRWANKYFRDAERFLKRAVSIKL